MKKNILLSGVTAVAIHALILSAPLSETKHNRTPGQIYEPISIRIISPQKTTAAAPPVQIPIKPPFEAGSNVSCKQTVISKNKGDSSRLLAAKDIPLKKSSPEEATKSELTANSSNQNKLVKVSFPDRMRKDQTKKIETTPPVKTASTAGHGLRRGEESIGTSQEKGAAQGNIVYARPKYKQNPPPHYPEVAKRRGYEGKTLLKVKVLENGKAGNIEVEESSGFKVLDTAALRSVRGWTFVPGTINGKRTEQWIRVPIRFVLK
jgi:TonB family protein